MAILRWAQEQRVDWHYITPGKPPSPSRSSAGWRDEYLNETLFTSLPHARAVLAAWKDDYNLGRPHSGVGHLPPAVYNNLGAPVMQRDGAPGASAASRCLTHRSRIKSTWDSTHRRMKKGAQVS
jgi:putative transposase